MTPRAYLFDLDGTLYRGHEPVPGAVEAVRALVARGALARYLTNNATLTREEFAVKLQAMGFPARPQEVYTSATGTADHLVEKGCRSAFVVGMPGLVSILRAAGIKVVNAGEDGVVGSAGERAETVVVGLCRTFTYDLLEAAMTQVGAGAQFVATNPDASIPLDGGRLAPGAGSLVAALRTCTGVEPFVVGKPKPFLVQAALRDASLLPSEVLVVGDRLDTDIEAGRAAGCPTYLVLTGVEKTLPGGQAGGESVRSLTARLGEDRSPT